MNRTSAVFARQQTCTQVALAACFAWMLLLGIPIRAEPQTRLPEYSPGRDAPSVAVPADGERNSTAPVYHVVLGAPNGVLIGRVVAPVSGAGPGIRRELPQNTTGQANSGPQIVGNPPFRQAAGAAANLRVALVRDGRAVALTRTDQSGRFALRNLSQGQYEIVVDGPGSPSRRTCRVWVPSSAPPSARASVEMILGEGIVRGQHPFPILAFPQVAAVAAVAAGAIAAPIVYHNVRTANRGPASP